MRLREKDEIILYKIRTLVEDEKVLEIEEKKGLFKKPTKETKTVVQDIEIVYSLTYRVDEDRFWFNKTVDGENVDSHHTKNNLTKSLSIIKGIEGRLIDLGYKIENLIDLETNDRSLFNKLRDVSRDIEKEKRQYNNQPEKKEIKGIFL